MVNDHTFSYWANKRLVSPSVCKKMFFINRKLSVSLAVFSPFPLPTISRIIYMPPESGIMHSQPFGLFEGVEEIIQRRVDAFSVR